MRFCGPRKNFVEQSKCKSYPFDFRKPILYQKKSFNVKFGKFAVKARSNSINFQKKGVFPLFFE